MDWLRLVNQEIRVDELKRLVKAVYIRFPPALYHVLYQISPQSGALWELLSEKAHVDLLPWYVSCKLYEFRSLII